jgi:hypothetical protein
MTEQTVEMAGAMVKAGVGLLALPLVELPAIAFVQIRADGAQAQVALQLAAVQDGGEAAALLAWADVLPASAATGLESNDYIRLSVSGVIDGVCVEVWTHLRGEHLVDTGCFLSLPLDGGMHVLPLGALRALAQHRAVSTNA